MSGKRIGFGLIGLGAISSMHSKALKESEKCTLVAAYDIVPEKVTAFSSANGCKGYNSLDAFLSDPDLDVVVIGTPSGSHLEPALASIEAGKNVLIEKPLEVTVKRCEMIVDAAKRKGVMLGGIFQTRFFDAPLLIKKAIEEGRFGRLLMIEASVKWNRSQEYYDNGKWRGTWDGDGGGALANQGIHALDFLRWFGGPVEEVKSMGGMFAHKNIEVEDNLVSILRFKSGCYGIIEASTGIYPGSPKRIEVCGEKGTAVLSEESLVEWNFKDETDADEEIRKRFIHPSSFEGGSSDPSKINYTGHTRQFDDFANAIIEGHGPMVTGEEAMESIKLLNMVYVNAGLR